jgi:hypothetical protein
VTEEYRHRSHAMQSYCCHEEEQDWLLPLDHDDIPYLRRMFGERIRIRIRIRGLLLLLWTPPLLLTTSFSWLLQRSIL